MSTGGPTIASIKNTAFYRDVYEPAEDSFALVDALAAHAHTWRRAPPRLCLEVGCGSGYVVCSLALLLRGAGAAAQLLATDINPAAAAATAETLEAHGVHSRVDVLLTDLALVLLPALAGRVDVLVFNPPYVPTPEEEVERGGIAAAWAGGERGRRVVDRLLPLVPALLSPRGEMFMVAVHENEPEELLALMRDAGLEARVALQRKADEEQRERQQRRQQDLQQQLKQPQAR
ncbi:hemK methyltransferase family member 2 [Micractinium conductrix]|uniref:HemK methyltransferase family member 2 n=1 Tax=Micractinium conductrix TaxID=554055 RepID=A0A2P6V2W2_9CHLO|nr:hemK methyltransferase family member 2 [Micractinium conductrix]|eukprot:PSC68421.1 hemK methyltransferase family member 2 [Micractinium conductrix]